MWWCSLIGRALACRAKGCEFKSRHYRLFYINIIFNIKYILF